MSSVVGICNRALQKLGASKIMDIAESSKNARSCLAAYDAVLEAELRKHTWAFAVKRVQLATNLIGPTHGQHNAFTLPADFIRLLDPDSQYNYVERDWNIEGRELLAYESGPISIRYVAKVTDPNQMDSLFREVFAAKLAEEMCEELTQSNAKREGLAADYQLTIREAKKTNAIEKASSVPPEDSWVTVRR